MKKRHLLLALLLCSVFLPKVFSQDDSLNQEDAIEKLSIVQFDIDGLKRTKRPYMDSLLNEFLQKPASKETLRSIETKLQGQNLFDQIKVSARALEDGQAAVNISFKEKWSVLPLPFGYYSDGSYAVGLFLMDMNAFGLGCAAVAGGLYSPTNVMGAGAFKKPPTQKGKLGFSVAGNISKTERVLTDTKNRSVFGYDNFYLGFRSSLLFKPTNHTSASVGVGYSFFNPIDSPKVNKMNQWSAEASFGISSSDWNGYFLCSNSLSVGADLYFSDNSEQRFAQIFSFSGQCQQPILERLRLMSGMRGFLSNNLYVSNYVGRASSGVTLLPKNFLTPQIFGFFTGFEAVVAKAKIGMMSVYAIYEVALARDWDKTFYSCHGPEAGVRFYFAKLAFPAFAMGASYNIDENRIQYSISGGASF